MSALDVPIHYNLQICHIQQRKTGAVLRSPKLDPKARHAQIWIGKLFCMAGGTLRIWSYLKSRLGSELTSNLEKNEWAVSSPWQSMSVPRGAHRLIEVALILGFLVRGGECKWMDLLRCVLYVPTPVPFQEGQKYSFWIQNKCVNKFIWEQKVF